jgi:hypothetical protein
VRAEASLDSIGKPWKDADAFRDAFNRLRNALANERPSASTKY